MSMDAHRIARLIFAAVLCAGALAAGSWYLWSSGQYTPYRIETHDSVSGLIGGSPVELHGVEVGKVTKIELADPRTVAILLSIAKDAPVSRATVATITGRGLAARGFTGYVYVALENTGADSGPLIAEPGRGYRVIPTTPSRIDTMDTNVADAVQKVRVLTGLLQSVLDAKTIVSLKQSVNGLQEVMNLLAANHERLDSLITNAAASSRQLSLLLDEKTVSSLKRSVDGLQEVMATLAANSEQLKSLIINADRDSRDIRPLLETSSTTLRELRQVLPRFYQAIGDLDGLTHSLNEVANRVIRNPAMVIRGTVTPPGPGER
jgi:phospholipid/cholesterol/gamma-HCH transport system substrate-binding protein